MNTILVADDDHRLLNMVRRTLSYEGFRVVTASDGQEALAQVKAERPEAIVLDWMMPELDGVEVKVPPSQQVPRSRSVAPRMMRSIR